jgi:hypothetical protein
MLARRTAAWLTAIMAAAALAPVAAEATHKTGWLDGGASVPANVDLEEVAANGSGVVIAVGQDTTSGTAVIYRRASGQWVQDTFTAPAGSKLVDVALSENAAWAVGTSTNGSEPFALRVDGGETELEGTSAASWVAPTGTLPAGTIPQAVGIRAGSGLDGLIGTAAGTVFPFHDAGNGTLDAVVTGTPAAGPINAIDIFSGDGSTGKVQAFTAGDAQSGNAERIYKVDTSQSVPTAKMLPVGMSPSDPDFDLVGIGADTETEALAIEENADSNTDPALWRSPTPWTRDGTVTQFTTASKPADLSLEKPDTVVLRAVAGEHGSDGAVWRRSGGGTWSRDDAVSPEPLNGVAIVEETDIWAVGDDGAIKHYTPLADPPAPDTIINFGPPATTPDPMASFTFSSNPSGADFECSLDGGEFLDCNSPKTVGPLPLGTHTFEVRAREGASLDVSPAARTVTIVEPETTITSGPTGSTEDQTPTFTFASDLASATFQCSRDGGPFAACSSPLTLSELAEGTHTLQVRASSSVGTDQTPASQSFVVDVKDPPCVEVPRPLLRNVVVRKQGGVLVIAFDLVATARVKAKAYHGAELIGRTKEKVFRAGQHSLRLRWKGSGKPTRLKMSASPAAPNACK